MASLESPSLIMWRGIVFFVVVLPKVYFACMFPDFVQTNGSHRDWRSGIQSQYTDFTLSVNITGSVMATVATDPSAPNFNRICIQSHSSFRYVVAHEERRQRSAIYQCVQFLKRGDNVFQLKISDTSASMETICDQDLNLDPWIFVDKANVLQDSHICPLTGGFGVRLYDKEYYKSVCGGYSDNVRLESECIEGEGLYFYYRYPRCIPSVLMSTSQRTICVANWTEGDYTFMLIRHDTNSYMWLMRYPSDHRSGFVANLMKELYASTDPYLTETNKYVKMDMVQDIARPVSSLCIDDFEACSHWDNGCTAGDITDLTCARTCGLCNVTRPSVCHFQTDWEGDWIDASHGDRIGATFEPNILTVYYRRMSQKLHCTRWDEPYSGPTIRHTTYEMLVTDFENGCRPKYSCAKLVHKAPSPVMFIQLSNHRAWPFTNRVTDPVNCNSFDFDGEETSLIPNRYRSKHYKLLYSSSSNGLVTCNMPARDDNYTVTLSDDTRCTARLQTRNNNKSVFVSLSRCSQGGEVLRSLPTVHNCVESSRLFSSRELLVVSRTPEKELFHLYCWLFARNSKDDFYLVEVAHCNENTRRRITKGHHKPLATFSRNQGLSSTVKYLSSTPQTQATRSRYPSLGENSIIDSTPSVVNNDSYGITNNPNSTKPPSTTNPATYASPVVVIAAIIFFVIFQIPCLCKNA